MLLVSQRVEAPRMEQHISLQGSIKRKLESSGSPANHDKISELSDGAFSGEVKRICLDDVSLPMGQGDTSSVLRTDVHNSSLPIVHRGQALQNSASMGSSLGCVTPGTSTGLLGGNQANGGDISSQFAVTSNAEMKPNVGDGHNMFYDSKAANNITMDPDLVDLLEELTNIPNSPLNELDILSTRSDPLNLGLVQTSQSTTRKSSPQAASHLENPIPNREFSPNYNQASGGSPQRRPPSAGASYPLSAPPNPMPLPMSSASQNQGPSQSQPSLLSGTNANRVGTNWHELSHAQQLKKIAASQHQRSVSQQSHPQQGQTANWPPVPSSGPSPPYQPDKLPSPSLHQQPFSPPNAILPSIPPSSNPASSMQSYLYNKVPSSQPARIAMLAQQQASLSQGPVNENSLPSEQLSFSNTKPLSHFDPDLPAQKMPSVAGGQSQPAVVHYMHQAPTTVQQPPQSGSTQQLQFRNKFRMQHLRLQNNIQHSQDPNPSNNYIKATSHAFLKHQLLKKQHNLLQQQLMADQEKQRQHEQLNGHMIRVSPEYKEQRSAFGVQQLNQFQAVAQSLPTNSGQPLPTPPSAHCGMRLNPSLLQVTSQNNLGPGIPAVTASQADRTMGMYPSNPGNQQNVYIPPSGINMPLRPSQSALGMRTTSQAVPSQAIIRQRTAISGFTGSVPNPAAPPQHVRQSINQAGATMPVQGISNALATSGMAPQMWAQQRIQGMQNQTKMDGSMQQFSNNPLFPKQSMRPNLPVHPFPHQTIAPPNQIAPGGQMKPLQQLTPGQTGQTMVSMSGPSPRHNQQRLPSAAMASMKPVPQGITSMSQTHPVPGLSAASYASSGQSTASYNRMNPTTEVSSFDFLQHNNSNALGGARNEPDFIESIMKSNSSNDDWINDLTLDDFLGQHS
ncbi:mastermind-like protein 2 [Pristis pectinata]|uniref:mastermind-like protein 2 n=1 Tax=Pristis pectinata TaxID=685728 RepID=UPI00223D794D|nr:mastermind-like protein 2 [Pristis pectinata]